ncbi:MAG: sigma-70 family RNA polymerase sigma factor [Planctomycetota bacterium]
MAGQESDTTHLLRKWHAGDRAALEALLERDLAWIHQFVHRRLGQHLRRNASTTDFLHDAVTEILEYTPRFELSNKSQFRALVGRIVDNLLRDKDDWYRARRRERARECPLPADTVLLLDPPAESVDSPSVAGQRNEAKALIRLGMDLLDQQAREILVLHQWDELSFAQIASRIGISEAAARKRHERAVKELAIKVGLLRRSQLDLLLGEDREDASS